MKLKLSVIAVFAAVILYQPGIYSIEVQSVNGQNISLNTFSGKKMLIAVFNAAAPANRQLLFLDSLQAVNPAIKVIAVPATDFNGPGSNASLNALQQSLGLDYLMMKQTRVKKAGINQHPLFRWLTYQAENGHFNADVEAVGQLFAVSASGTLYAVLNRDTPNAVLQQVITNTAVQ